MTATSKVYDGDRTIDGVVVRVSGGNLPNNPDGDFEWGYEGAGPLRLAEAILTDHLADAQKARVLAPRFMQDVVASFANEWEVTSEDVDLALGVLRPSSP